MAQGTPDLEQYLPAGLRLLEHRPASGGESEREQARALLSGPQARISRLRNLADLDEPSRPEPARATGRTRNRGGDRSEADAGALIGGAPKDLTGVIEAGPDGPSRNGDDLAESDLDNLTAVLGHEVAPNTMKNYRVQWNNFVNWAAAKGIRSLPADPRHVAAYLAERIEEHGHKPATLRAAAAAIAFIHRSAGQVDPYASPEVKRTLRSATRKAGRGQKQAQALTDEALTAIRSTACNPRPSRGGRPEGRETAMCRGNLDIALISLMRDAMLRVSEAAVLTWSDIVSEADGTGRLLIRRSKTDAEGEGAVGFLSIPTMEALRLICGARLSTDSVFGAAPQPDLTAHQAGGAGGGAGGRLQRSLPACGHGPGPGEGRNRAAQPDERRALAHPGHARSLHPQRDRRQGSGGAVPRLLPPCRMNGKLFQEENPIDGD